MYKFAFTYLVKQDRKTWKDFENSLKLLNKNILSKLICNYKIIIFCEGKPIKAVKYLVENLIRKEKVKILFKEISLIKYVKRKSTDTYIKDFPSSADCKTITTLGYRDMCKFFAYDIFFDEKFNDTEYFVRMDTDSFFISTNNRFIKKFTNFKKDYGYIKNTVQNEDKSVSLGFGKCLWKFHNLKKNKLSESEYILKICQEATIKPKIFYTNFEIVKINWARSNSHKKIMNYIINSKGIYNHRWGDALIRYYVINLLKAKKESLYGCLYKHSGIYESRNIFRMILTKSYSKIRGKLHKNNYEKHLTNIDKLFLGIY